MVKKSNDVIFCELVFEEMIELRFGRLTISFANDVVRLVVGVEVVS